MLVEDETFVERVRCVLGCVWGRWGVRGVEVRGDRGGAVLTSNTHFHAVTREREVMQSRPTSMSVCCHRSSNES